MLLKIFFKQLGAAMALALRHVDSNFGYFLVNLVNVGCFDSIFLLTHNQ